MPKLSVIVPVYNTEKYLRECVDSILAQTFTDFELILVNDGSTDGSGAICDEYASKDSRIRAIHQENAGVTVARRSGVEDARGEYIAFVDSDDWIEPHMHQDMIAEAEMHCVELVICDMVLETQTGQVFVRGSHRYGLFSDEQLEQQIYGGMLFDFVENGPGISMSLCNKLIKSPLAKSVFAALPEDVTYGEDAVGTLMCMLEAKCVYIMKGVAGYHYRQAEEFSVRERSISLLTRLSDFANRVELCFARYGFDGQKQLAGYVAQMSLYCIRQILLFNADHTMSEKIFAVKAYLQEMRIRKFFVLAEALTTDRNMRRKLKLVNQNRYFLLLVLFAGKEMVLWGKRHLRCN